MAVAAAVSSAAVPGSLIAARAFVTRAPLAVCVHWALSVSSPWAAWRAAAALCWVACSWLRAAATACCPRVADPTASVAAPSAAWSILVWIRFAWSSATSAVASLGVVAWESLVRRSALSLWSFATLLVAEARLAWAAAS